MFLIKFGSHLYQKCFRYSQKSLTCFEAGSKMKSCVSTASARADRGSDPPEKLTKTAKNRSANQHTYNTDFTAKSGPKDSDETYENPTSGSPSRPSLPKLLHVKSERFPAATPITLKNAFHHPVPDPLVFFLLIPWSPSVTSRCQNGQPRCQNGSTKPPKWQPRKAKRGRRQKA